MCNHQPQRFRFSSKITCLPPRTVYCRWSFGVLMFEMFSLGHTPYPLIEPQSMIAHLEAGNRLQRPRFADDEMLAFFKSISMSKEFYCSVFTS
jgi:hypothetical protein